MLKRRRSEDTKQRILRVACAVFSEKGYRDATHAEICERAGANVAAINYYFGSKDNLYRAAVEDLLQKVEAKYPLSGGLPASAAPEQRLHAFIQAQLGRIFDPELLGDIHRLRMAEAFEPTGLLDDILTRQLAHDRRYVQNVIGELLSPGASQKEIEWCEMSIVAQCFVAVPGPGGDGPRKVFKLDASDIDRLGVHILKFSLAGVEAIRQARG